MMGLKFLFGAERPTKQFPFLPRDVILLIFKHAALLDYNTCCSVRLNAKWAALHLTKQQHLWCLHEGIVKLGISLCKGIVRIENQWKVDWQVEVRLNNVKMNKNFHVQFSNFKFHHENLRFSLTCYGYHGETYWESVEMRKKIQFFQYGCTSKQRLYCVDCLGGNKIY